MKLVHVAVAVIENDNGDILIAKRPDHLHMGGFWEFPGGKVEAGETVLLALQREIHEEVALDIHAAQPLLQIPFQYPDKKVLLDVWHVKNFFGVAQGCEGQQIVWVSRTELCQYEFPPANRAILTALRLPDRLLITGEFLDVAECLQRTRTALEKHGIRAVMLRAHQLTPAAYLQLANEMAPLCQQHNAQLLLNTAAESFIGQAEGLHLSSPRLQDCRERPVSTHQLFGASCHNQAEIEQALALGADYLLLSPVLPTSTHPDALPLGWDGLAALLTQCPVPVFALGGLTDQHLQSIKALGAFGIAGIAAWW
ncbi:MAG TPA: Nudix family hydrolase [Pseudomonadales bacterium]|nr:Nudix family hydrolase [Pseudomonadales bacterium]